MKGYLQLLGGGGAQLDVACSALLFFDKRRYLFECGEGTQRLCLEHKVRLRRLSAVFVSQASARSLSGLPGMLLTLADIGATSLAVCGPAGVVAFRRAMRHFMGIKKTFQVDMREAVAGKDVFSDDLISVRPIAVSVPSAVRHPTVCYVVRTPDVRGKLDMGKATQLGVPKGPLLGMLAKGEPIELESGLRVDPAQVLGPATPGMVFLLLNLVSPAQASVLLRSAEFGELVSGAPATLTVVHMSGSEALLGAEQYRELCAALPSTAHHVFPGADQQVVPFRASAYNNLRMARLDASFFEAPHMAANPGLGSAIAALSGLGSQAVRAKSLDKLHFFPAQAGTPKFIKAVSDAPTFDPARELVDVDTNEAYQAQVAAYKEWEREQPPADAAAPTVVFLGTGCAIPSKYRNVSAILLRLAPGGDILLDAGEGTYGQLCRRFGRDAGDELLRNLGAVWISHQHADHHLGLIALLENRTALGGPPLVVMGGPFLQRWLSEFDACSGKGLQYEFIDVQRSPKITGPELAPLEGLRLRSLQSVPVAHCRGAMGIVVETQSGTRIVYSGDTRPCDALVNAGKGADVLIHDATFEDSLIDEARSKNHSTVSEAIDVGTRMGARTTVLTHFSQRYPKLAAVPRDAAVGVAFDLMAIPVSEAARARLPRLLPALQELFPGEEEVEEIA